MGRIVFVTGTDTGVGKTFVSCGLLRALRRSGARVGARKPVETGCALRSGALHPADGAALAEAAGGDESLARVCPVRFAEPLAPAVAAARAGTTIDVPRLAAEARERAAGVDVLLVEGAGGLLVPLGRRQGRVESFADLALRMAAELIVVAGARLGAINHTLLTLEVARAFGLDVLGTVVNHFTSPPEEERSARQTLVATLRDVTGIAPLAEIAHGADPETHLSGVAVRLVSAP